MRCTCPPRPRVVDAVAAEESVEGSVLLTCSADGGVDAGVVAVFSVGTKKDDEDDKRQVMKS